MFSENIGNDYIVIQEGTSEGTQVKYKKDGYWYNKVYAVYYTSRK